MSGELRSAASNPALRPTLLACLLLVAAVLAIYGAVTTSTFAYTRLRVDGASYTKSADVAAALAERDARIVELEAELARLRGSAVPDEDSER